MTLFTIFLCIASYGDCRLVNEKRIYQNIEQCEAGIKSDPYVAHLIESWNGTATAQCFKKTIPTWEPAR
jgi:hypothetical protein